VLTLQHVTGRRNVKRQMRKCCLSSNNFQQNIARCSNMPPLIAFVRGYSLPAATDRMNVKWKRACRPRANGKESENGTDERKIMMPCFNYLKVFLCSCTQRTTITSVCWVKFCNAFPFSWQWNLHHFTSLLAFSSSKILSNTCFQLIKVICLLVIRQLMTCGLL